METRFPQPATDFLKVLSSETRFRILTLLLRTKKNICVKEIADAIGMSHSATSHQLTHLERSGLVSSFRNGQTICYEVCENTAAVKSVRKIVEALA